MARRALGRNGARDKVRAAREQGRQWVRGGPDARHGNAPSEKASSGAPELTTQPRRRHHLRVDGGEMRLNEAVYFSTVSRSLVQAHLASVNSEMMATSGLRRELRRAA